MGEKTPHGSHTTLQASHAKENVFPASTQQVMPHDQRPRCLLRLASASLRFQIQLWPILLIVPLIADEYYKERSFCIVPEYHAVFFSSKDFAISLVLFVRKPIATKMLFFKS
jgi:hypothetical protein